MSEIKDGGPAFPLTGTQWNPERDAYEVSPIDVGMTLRDYFATKAMPGIYERVCEMLAENGQRVGNVYEVVARAAYEQADAMLRARGG